MSERQAEGYDIPAVERWIAENVPGLSPPFTWYRLEGGHSNLTYQLTAEDGQQAVIRRPPQGQLLPKAHDMSREWALISALGPTRVPVPRALGFCEDPGVTGAWFYIMSKVEGRALFNVKQTLEWVPADKRVGLAHSCFDVLAELHALDPDEIGLGDLGKKENYVGRQLKTWYRSWTSSVEPAQFDDPRAHELQRYFLDHLPEQGKARVIHGDYALRNCLTGADSTVVAVLDWEISTLGDPLADLAYTLNEWYQPGDTSGRHFDVPSAAPGFPTRDEMAQRYADRTGRHLDNLDYYLGFNHWKSAAILHGVYARYREGKKSTVGIDLEKMSSDITALMTAAEQAVNRLG